MPKPENIIPHQFKPGESGNPKGREKGSKNHKTIIRKWLDTYDKVKNPITNEELVTSVEEKMVLAMVAGALSGDVRAYNALMDRVYGKSRQSVELAGPGGGDIPISTTTQDVAPIDYSKLSDKTLMEIIKARVNPNEARELKTKPASKKKPTAKSTAKKASKPSPKKTGKK